MGEARLDLEVSYAARQPWVPSRRQLTSWAKAALRAGPARTGNMGRVGSTERTGNMGRTVRMERTVLSVRVVGRARGKSLNQQYRRKPQPTNVLSFDGAGAMPDGRRHLGELVMCAPVVAREARAQGKSLQAHWAHLTVHGVLHLRGHDHEAAREAAKMEALEIQILDRLGFSDPYR